MLDRVIVWLARLWAVNDSKRLPKEVDLIALVSIGAKQKDLTRGAYSTVNRAKRLLEKYGNKPWVVFGAFTGNGDHSTEERLKSDYFDGDRHVYVGMVLSTISECLAYKSAFPSAKSVIFVTEEGHSRRARIIWKCLWPEAEIFIVPVPIKSTLDVDSPMRPYRKIWTILAFQALPTPVYWAASLLGPKYMKKLGGMHQPITR